MKNRLKEMRESQKLTQEELSNRSGVSRVTISGLESGRTAVVKTDTLIKNADALNEPVSKIFFCS